MRRKPLISIEDGNSNYYINSAYSILISGNMGPIKGNVLNAVLHKKDTPVVVINLDNSSSYMQTKGYNYYFSLYGDTGYDIFSTMTIRETCMYLQNIAYEKNYSDEQVVQIIKYLNFIEKYNAYYRLNLRTVREINSYYYKPDVIANGLDEMYQAGEITLNEYDFLNVSFVRSIKGQLIIDNLLASTDFDLNNSGDSHFSINSLKRGQTALIDLSTKHNNYTEKKSRKDVLYSIEEYSNNIVIALNIGKADYSMVADFINNITTKITCRVIIFIDDIFAQCQQYDAVRRGFSLNLLGQHTGESCRKMSECFNEVYKRENHYARTIDSRLLADRFIDHLFHTNHTNTTTTYLVKRRLIEQQDIANLSDRAFILLDNTGNTNYFSLYSI